MWRKRQAQVGGRRPFPEPALDGLAADAGKHGGLTMIGVPTDAPGIEIKGIPTMGAPAEVNDVYFTDVEIDASAVVGEPEQAWMQLMAGLNTERLIIAAGALGTGWTAFDEALAYVKEREQFGRPIGSFQAIKHKCADMLLEVESGKSAAYYAAWAAAEPWATARMPNTASRMRIIGRGLRGESRASLYIGGAMPRSGPRRIRAFGTTVSPG